jgi:hypothetical protein
MFGALGPACLSLVEATPGILSWVLLKDNTPIRRPGLAGGGAMQTVRSEHEATEGRKAHEATEERKQEEAREHDAAQEAVSERGAATTAVGEGGAANTAAEALKKGGAANTAAEAVVEGGAANTAARAAEEIGSVPKNFTKGVSGDAQKISGDIAETTKSVAGHDDEP